MREQETDEDDDDNDDSDESEEMSVYSVMCLLAYCVVCFYDACKRTVVCFLLQNIFCFSATVHELHLYELCLCFVLLLSL